MFAQLQYLLTPTPVIASAPLLKLSKSFEEFLLREVMVENALSVQLQTRVLACAELLPASLVSFKVKKIANMCDYYDSFRYMNIYVIL